MHGDKYFKIIPPAALSSLPSPSPRFPFGGGTEERRTPVSRGMATIITRACFIEEPVGEEGWGEEEKEKWIMRLEHQPSGRSVESRQPKYIRKFESSIRNNEVRATTRTRRYGEDRGQKGPEGGQRGGRAFSRGLSVDPDER